MREHSLLVIRRKKRALDRLCSRQGFHSPCCTITCMHLRCTEKAYSCSLEFCLGSFIIINRKSFVQFCSSGRSVYCLSLVCLVCFVFVLFRSQHCSVIQSCSTLCDPHGLQHSRFPCPSPSPGACSNSCPLSQWWHSAISSPIVPFFSCLQSFPASGSFLMNWLFESGGQTIGASASASVLPVNIQGWFHLGFTGLVSLPSKGLSRGFFSTTIRKHQFFGTQQFFWSSSHICTWLLEKP